MPWVARALLLVPSIIAGWLVAKGDGSFWVVAFVIALLLIAAGSALFLYAPRIQSWMRDRED